MPPLLEDTEQRLLEAAGQVFADKGLKAATVRDICALAGANVAAVNYYFHDKEQLYVATVLHAHRSCLQRVPPPEWSPGTPPLVKLRDFIRTFLMRVIVDREPGWHARLIMRELFEPTEACARAVEEFIRPTFGTLKTILDELLPPEVPEQKRRLIGFSIVGQCLHYRVTRPILMRLVGEEQFKAFDVELLTDHIFEFTLGGIGLKNRAARRVEGKS
jgi:AcrR family transcriptional regulator